MPEDNDNSNNNINHNKSNKLAFQCKYCVYSSGSSKRLITHTEKYHHDEIEKALKPAFDCVMCDETFSDKEQLKYHLNVAHLTPVTSVTSVSLASFQCCICTLKFDTRIILILHLRKVHSMSPEEAEDIVTELTCGGQETDEAVLDKVLKSPETSNEVKTLATKFGQPKSEFCCWLCKQKFSDVMKFSSHISEDHQDHDDGSKVAVTEALEGYSSDFDEEAPERQE